VKRSAVLVGAALTAAALILPGAAAQTVSAGDAWARPATDTGGVFLTIRNTGEADRLVAAASDVAAHVELHESMAAMHMGSMGSVMTMHRVASIAVAAHGTTLLKPGGYHIMLIGLKHPLKAGDTIPLRLTFAAAGTIAVTAAVRPM
jgi:hypothetical protein